MIIIIIIIIIIKSNKKGEKRNPKLNIYQGFRKTNQELTYFST